MDAEQKTVQVITKNPGRVAQGHKLAALMKKRKEELVQNKPSEQVAEQPKEQPKEQVKSYEGHMLGVGALAILAITLGVYYYFPKQKAPPKEERKSDQKDPFRL
jgi:uncharacterized protein HemX